MFGGLTRFSLIDYPGELSAVVFTKGCNFRCPYCHNPELVNNTAEEIEIDEILGFLKKRMGKLTAVSITGGEPTLHGDKLVGFIRKLKDMGYKVKIDTNGTNPGLIERLLSLNLLDYIAMDVKAPIEKYNHITNTKTNTQNIKDSIGLLLNARIPYEFRTTVVKDLITEDDIAEIAKFINGAELFCIQNFIPTKTLNPSFKEKSGYSHQELLKMKQIANRWVKRCIIR